jgi:hypothetical protein
METTLTAVAAPTIYIPPPVEVRTAEERRLVLQFLALLRRCQENAIITLLKESTGFRWWANGQPAGVLRVE